MATPADARRLTRRVDDLIRAASTAEGAAARQVLTEVDTFRRELLDLVASDRTFADVARRIDTRANALRTTLTRIADTTIADATRLGVELVDAPLGDAGIRAARTALDLGNVAEDHRTLARTLIGDHTGRLADKARAVALRARAVPDGRLDALKAIGGALRGSVTLAGPANYLAAAARTATATATSDASYRRMRELEAGIPDLRKRWATGGTRTGHRAGHKAIATSTADGIPIDRPYRIAGVACQWPRDPALPPRETVNCRCHSVVHLATNP